MAVDFNNGTIFLGSAVVAAEPVSMAAWFNADFNNTPETIIGVFSTTGGTSYFQIETTGNDHIFSEKNSVFNGDNTVNSTGTYAAGTWHHAGAVFADTTHQATYLDGAKDSAVVPAFTFFHPLVQTQVSGRWFVGSFERPFDGCLAQAAVWNAALSDADMTNLAAGANPSAIKPANLVFYAPIATVGTLLVNLAGPGLSSSGGPFVQCASGPPILAGAGQTHAYIIGCRRTLKGWRRVAGATGTRSRRSSSGLILPKGFRPRSSDS